MCDKYVLLFMSLRAFFCKWYNLLVVDEFPHAVTPHEVAMYKWKINGFQCIMWKLFFNSVYMNIELAILDFNLFMWIC